MYISLFDSPHLQYSMEPAWYIDQRGNSDGNIRMIPPVITDLNGDGSNEIVMITKDMNLKILSAQIDSPSNDIYHPVESSSVRLSSIDISTVIYILLFSMNFCRESLQLL